MIPRPWLRGTRPYWLLLGLCLALYLPGISLMPPLDRDEARFAQASRQMLETGDFLRIRFQDEARNKKPAGIYWLQAASVSLFSSPESQAIWPYRIPSLLGATTAVLLVFAVGSRLREEPGHTGTPAAAIASVLLASCIGVVAEAHIAKSDAVLLAATTAGQILLGLTYIRRRAGQPVSAWVAAGFWLAEIVAIMIKGPPGPMLALVTMVALSIADGSARWLLALRPVLGAVLLAAAVGPWLMAIQGATEGRFLADSLGTDLWRKIIDAQEAHGAPPFAYLLMAVATFWPGSVLLVPALIRGWRRREHPSERFLLAWLVPSWVLLELVPTKLPHYVLPLFPALALLAGATLVEGISPAAKWLRRLDIGVRWLWAAVGVGLAAVIIVLPLRFGPHLSVPAIIGAGILLALVAGYLRYGPRTAAAAGLAAVLSFVFIATTAWAVLPGLDRLWLSRSAARLVAEHPPEPGTPLVAVGYSEPSLVFLLGTGLRIASPRSAVEAIENGGEALVSSREDPIFRQSATARGLVAQALGSVPGIDYSNGQRMVLTLYRLSPG